MTFTHLSTTVVPDENGMMVGYSKKIAFKSGDQALAWQNDMMSIKVVIAEINLLNAANKIPAVHLLTLREWLLQVEHGIATWGLALIPLDIRNGVHSVQEALNLSMTVFGEDCGGSISPAFDQPTYVVTIPE